MKFSKVFYIYGDIEEFHDYGEIFTELEKANEKQNILIRVNSPGGAVDTGMAIINAIKDTSAHVVCSVEYPSFSMGALIALSGDFLICRPHTYLMFHDYNHAVQGKGTDLFKSNEAFNQYYKSIFIDTCHPFLTLKECDAVLSGVDKYVHASEMHKRITRHFGDK